MNLGVLTDFGSILVSSGEPNDLFFLTYLVILNLGIMVYLIIKMESLFLLAFLASHFVLLYGYLIDLSYMMRSRENSVFHRILSVLLFFLSFGGIYLDEYKSKNKNHI